MNTKPEPTGEALRKAAEYIAANVYGAKGTVHVFGVVFPCGKASKQLAANIRRRLALVLDEYRKGGTE